MVSTAQGSPFGYHVERHHRHRNIFQKLTGTGRKYNYYVKPNSMGMMGGMNPMMNPMMMMPGVGQARSITMTTAPMMGMGMGTTMLNSTLTQACRSNDTNALRYVNCPHMTPADLHFCINKSSEPFLASLVRKCKGTFTRNPYQMALHAVELILANKTMAFGSIITRNTCLMLGPYEKRLILKTAIIARTKNTFAFVDHILTTCYIPAVMTAGLQAVALMTGDTSTAVRLQRAAVYPVNRETVQRIINLPSGRMINLNFDGALATITGRDMSVLGKIGRVCRYLRPQHITHPLFSSELLSEMNENCFKHLNPRIFWYMTADMVKRFRWWRSATPAQMHWLPIGKPIQAVPFYDLGTHVYINPLDRYHPCKGITKSQRISIQMNPKLARAFYERCRASGATAVKASISLLVVAVIGYVAITFF